MKETTVKNFQKVRNTLISAIIILSCSTCMAVNADEKPMVSGAFNMQISGLNENVNPQTGSLSLTFPAAKIPGKNGLDLDLSLHYTQTNQDDVYDIAKGWSFTFTYYDTKQKLLHLANGGTYQPDNTSYAEQSGLKYYKKKDLQFTSLDNEENIPGTERPYKYKVHYVLDGRDEYLDNNGRLLEISNVFGNHIKFYYKNESSSTQANLESIIDSYGQTIQIDNNNQRMIVHLPKKSDSFTYIKGSNKLLEIKDPLQRQTRLRYQSDGLIDQISYPTGALTTFRYQSMPIKTSQGTTASIPYINEMIQSPGTGPSMVTKYKFLGSSKSNIENFTGYPKYTMQGEDKLLETGSNSENYEAEIIRGNLTTVNTYNHLHLLIKSEIKDKLNANNDRTTTYHYPDEGQPYNTLKANYQTPQEETISFGRTGQRSMTRSMHYNDYGQPEEETDFNGNTAITSYEKSGVNNPLHMALSKTITTPDHKTEKEENIINSEQGPYQVAKQLKYSGEAGNMQLINTTDFEYYQSGNYKGAIKSQKVINNYHNENTVSQHAVASIENTYHYGENSSNNTHEITTTNQLGNSTTDSFDAVSGLEVSKKDAEGNKVTMHYDDLNRLTKEQSITKNGSTTTIKEVTYTPTSKTVDYPTTGLQEKTVYDGLGREIAEYNNSTDNGESLRANQLHPIKTISYNNTGKAHTVTDGNSHTYTNEYDSLGRLQLVINPDGSKQHYQYNDINNTQSSYLQGSDGKKLFTKTTSKNIDGAVINEANSSTTSNNLFNSNNTTQEKNITYDGFGKIRQQQTVNSQLQQSIEYTPFGQAKTVTMQQQAANDNQFIEAHYQYDPLVGKVTRETLSNTNTTKDKVYSTIYNAAGLITEQSDPDNNTQHFYYDKDGNIEKKIDWAKHNFLYQYQFIAGKNMLTKAETTDNNDKGIYTEYDNLGQPTSISYLDAKGKVEENSTIHYQYYLDGKIKSTTYPDQRQVERTYDNNGNLQSLTLKNLNNDEIISKTDYHYDSMNRITKASSAKATVTYHYNSIGQLERRKDYNGSNSDEDALIGTTEYSYNSLNAVSSINVLNKQGQQISYSEYQYYDNGNVKTKTVSQQGKEQESEFTYDIATNHLKQTKIYAVNSLEDEKTLEKQINYTLDISGNVLNTEIISGNNDTLKNDNQEAANSYNDLDQLKKFNHRGGFQYDENGNMLSDDQGNSYEYNAQNQLIRFSGSNSNSGEVSTTTYQYYADGTRASKTYDNGTKISFYYDDNILIAEKDQTGIYATYLMGLKREARTVNNVTSFYGYDRHGTVIAALYTNPSDNQFFDYDDYGQLTQQVAKQGIENDPFKYSGEYLDSESGLYYLKARYYSPRLQHFISRDSYPTINRYAYCGGNPIMRLDPSGNNFFSDFATSLKNSFTRLFTKGGIIGFAVSAAVSAAVVVSTVVTSGAAAPAWYYILTIGAASGAASSAISYGVETAINEEKFDTNAFFTNMGIGAAAGAISGGLGTAVTKKHAYALAKKGIRNFRFRAEMLGGTIGGISYSATSSGIEMAVNNSFNAAQFSADIVFGAAMGFTFSAVAHTFEAGFIYFLRKRYIRRYEAYGDVMTTSGKASSPEWSFVSDNHSQLRSRSNSLDSNASDFSSRNSYASDFGSGYFNYDNVAQGSFS